MINPSLTTINESNGDTLYPLNAIASSSTSPIISQLDEHSSRMRSHKGNRPSLPQSKHCPLCPAKFTRTTHLNRHLRTHTNERLHHCDTCLSEFTRSDLLTRHKRSCGDFLNQNKSRRKSCQACAESKVKCDLKQPCTKCASRGKECIFINDPAQSREKKAAAAARRKAAQKAATDASSVSSASPRLTPPTCDPMLYSSAYSYDSYDFEQDTETSLVAGMSSATSAFDISPISHSELLHKNSYLATYPELSGGSTTTRSSMSPRSEAFDVAADYYATSHEMQMLDESLSKIMSQDILPLYPESSLAMQPHDFAHTSLGLLDFGPETQSQWMMGGVLTACPPLDVDPFIPPLSGEATSRSMVPLNNAPSPLLVARETPTIDISPKDAPVGPAETELQHYLYLFHTAFQSHVPIVHPSTWTFEGKTTILGRATYACGAQFVNDRAAKDFVSRALHSTCESLLEVERTTESKELMDMILAGVLIQSISLFRQSIDQRSAAGDFHGMLMMMIRRCGLMNVCSSWTAPNLSAADAAQVDAAWRDWIAYESMKRLLTIAYVNDCFLNVFFSVPPSFSVSELDWCLPAEDALWKATSSQEWCSLLQQPSPYGSAATRLTGLSIKAALAVLSDVHMPTPGLTLPAFAHFVLINSILSSILSSDSQAVSASQPAPDHRYVLNGKPRDFALQYTLHNWLQGWVRAPDEPTAGKAAEEPLFTHNAMPYYWLAQATLVALQGAVSGKPGLALTPDTRFRVFGQWLVHIRNFLRRGQGDSAGLWIELMKAIAEDGHGARTGAEGIQALRPDL
ncbi:hypothetical protein F5148DRAFT_832637 [Russula earlei]|uniref:Uncharacterized protein n=1 Tax=Russula earlei TaxID=71964 RepID=A0ACC0UAZ9_9AGAM|nr:hypothetical protein F5148DRAFT_832637 [Russula earlei]